MFAASLRTLADLLAGYFKHIATLPLILKPAMAGAQAPREYWGATMTGSAVIGP
jgi:hypothetical protein